MNVLLKKILFKKQFSVPATLLISVAGLYLGFFLWYAIDQIDLLDNIKINVNAFSLLLSIPFVSITIIYKTIDSVFYNHRITVLLPLPLATKKLFHIYIEEIIRLPFELLILIFVSSMIYNGFSFESVKYCLLGIIFTYIVTLIIFIVCLMILNICPTHLIGYAFTLFQYSGFISVILLCNIYMQHFFKKRASFIIITISEFRFSYITFCGINCIFLVLTYISFILFNNIFLQRISKISLFQYLTKKSRKIDIFRMKHPLMYLERKRYLQNKEIVFYSGIKSIVTIVTIYVLFISKLNISEIGLKMLLIILPSASSIYSTTAYSSDSDYNKISNYLPISVYNVYKSKVITSFVLNEIITIIFFVPLSLNEKTSSLLSLLIWGTLSNFNNSTFGVLLDYFMPNRTQNKSELLHGNTNKLFTIAFAISRFLIEEYICIDFFKSNCILLASSICELVIACIFHILLKGYRRFR